MDIATVEMIVPANGTDGEGGGSGAGEGGLPRGDLLGGTARAGGGALQNKGSAATFASRH